MRTDDAKIGHATKRLKTRPKFVGKMAALCKSVRCVRALAHMFRHQPSATQVPVRWLNMHEYQSKQLMAENGIQVQRFRVVESVEEAAATANNFDFKEYVIKAQILAGGRGKGTFSSGLQGGVKLTKSCNEIVPIVEKMLGHKLKTKQTQGDGSLVSKVMIGEALDIKRETYLAILMDRDSGGPVIVASPAGGMDIEEVASQTPDLIFKEPVDILKGLSNNQAKTLAKNLQFEGNLIDEVANQIKKLYKLFLKVDATQIEINPFGETLDGQVICFDAKFNFDDNAQFRQKEIFSIGDNTECDPRELEASKFHLNYIGMDGNIACLVNGAGLAMATMDIIHLHGGSPANFLDVGGNVNEDQVYQAFKILTEDSRVKAILVNIFGGIVNCATIANGITNACKTMQLKVPLVVRLEGTNVEEAKRILSESGLQIITANDLDDAARKAVSSLKG